MDSNRPYEWALANFRCSNCPDRLRQTSKGEIDLALSRVPRGTIQALSSVYVIGNEANGLHKIGYADNLGNRLSGLSVGSPVPLFLRHFLYFVDFLVAQRVEKEAHRILAEYRRRGEWFDVTAAQAGEAIAQAVTAQRIKWWSEPERRELSAFVAKARAHHEKHQRLFG